MCIDTWYVPTDRVYVSLRENLCFTEGNLCFPLEGKLTQEDILQMSSPSYRHISVHCFTYWQLNFLPQTGVIIEQMQVDGEGFPRTC